MQESCKKKKRNICIKCEDVPVDVDDIQSSPKK